MERDKDDPTKSNPDNASSASTPSGPTIESTHTVSSLVTPHVPYHVQAETQPKLIPVEQTASAPSILNGSMAQGQPKNLPSKPSTFLEKQQFYRQLLLQHLENSKKTTSIPAPQTHTETSIPPDTLKSKSTMLPAVKKDAFKLLIRLVFLPFVSLYTLARDAILSPSIRLQTKEQEPKKQRKNLNYSIAAYVLVVVGFFGLVFGTISVLLVNEEQMSEDGPLHSSTWLTSMIKTGGRTAIPAWKNRFSTLNCKIKNKICHINNLYVIDGQMHVYLGKDAIVPTFVIYQNASIYTGIGFGSPIIQPILYEDYLDSLKPLSDRNISSPKKSSLLTLPDNSNDEEEEDVKHSHGRGHQHHEKVVSSNDSVPAPGDDWVGDAKQAFIVPLLVHRQDPPTKLTKTRYYKEPTAFFSVMWENLFRNIYAGVGAINSMLFFDTLNFQGKNRMILIEPTKPKKFVDDILQAATPFPIKWFGEVKNSLYQSATLGISRDFGISEIKVEMFFKYPRKILRRNSAFKFFCVSLKTRILEQRKARIHQVKMLQKMSRHHRDLDGNFAAFDVAESVLQQPDPPANMHRDVNSQALLDQVIPKIPPHSPGQPLPRMTLILRDGQTRKIINEKLLISTLRKLPVDLGVYRFGTISFSDQVAIIDKTDILVAMHGAALTHVLFLRPNSFVIEIFPFGFRKTVFDNISRLMGLRYMFWQNTHRNQTFFDWTYVEQHRFTQVPKNAIVDKPIDWYNMDSKNYWRNQDTIIDMPEFLQVVSNALGSQNASSEEYLIYQPWGFFTEQIESFRVACAMGHFLNRRVVLPLMGYQPMTPLNDDHHRSFRITRLNWKPFQYYVNQHDLSLLSCKWINYENFYNLNRNRTVSRIRILPDSVPLSFSEPQLLRYYHDMLYLPLPTILRDSTAFPRYDAVGLKRKYGSRRVPVLGFGAVPRTFIDFEAPVTEEIIPVLKNRTTLTPSNLKKPHANVPAGIKSTSIPGSEFYEQLIKHTTFREDLVNKAKEIVASKLNNEPFIALHIRRGNSPAKCDAMAPRFEPTWLTKHQPYKFGANGADNRQCYQNHKFIEWTLRKLTRANKDASLTVASAFQDTSRTKPISPKKLRRIARSYIAIDDLGRKNTRNELGDLGKTMGYSPPLFFTDVFPENELNAVLENTKTDTFFDYTNLPKYDAIELAMIEIMICVEADIFIGNRFSSFSREIVNQRSIRNRRSYYF